LLVIWKKGFDSRRLNNNIARICFTTISSLLVNRTIAVLWVRLRSVFSKSNLASPPRRVHGMAPSTLVIWHSVLVRNTAVLIIKRADLEEVLQELPAADDITNPHGDGSLTDVPKLINCSFWASEVVISKNYKNCVTVQDGRRTCSRWQRGW
jgi:hypothetical protein